MKNDSRLLDVQLEVPPGDLVTSEIFMLMNEEKHKMWTQKTIWWNIPSSTNYSGKLEQLRF